MFELFIILFFFIIPLAVMIVFALDQIRLFDESCERERYDAEDRRVVDFYERFSEDRRVEK